MREPNPRSLSRLLCPLLLLSFVAGCVTESHQALQVEHTASSAVPYRGVRSSIAVGKFDNRSTYLRGLFSDGVDRLGGQAQTILIGHLQETGRFNVLERENMDENAREARLSGRQQTLQGADFTLTWAICTTRSEGVTRPTRSS
jgi:curli biogenesis system outer membrane secretion channel CsgG